MHWTGFGLETNLCGCFSYIKIFLFERYRELMNYIIYSQEFDLRRNRICISFDSIIR